MLSLVYRGPRRYEPQVSWHRRTVDMTVTCSPDDHLMSAMESPLTCGCTTSECDGLACGLVVSTTAHGHGVDDRHTMKSDSGKCVEMQVAPKVHHPNKIEWTGAWVSSKRTTPK